LEADLVQSQEAYLFTEILESLSPPTGSYARWGLPNGERGMKLADPPALAAPVTPDLPLPQVTSALCWLTFRMTLSYWNVPLSVLGRWCGVHKTIVLRWMMGLELAVWPLMFQWILARVKAQLVVCR
jgi:hypothetical protein